MFMLWETGVEIMAKEGNERDGGDSVAMEIDDQEEHPQNVDSKLKNIKSEQNCTSGVLLQSIMSMIQVLRNELPEENKNQK